MRAFWGMGRVPLLPEGQAYSRGSVGFFGAEVESVSENRRRIMLTSRFDWGMLFMLMADYSN